MSILNSLFQGIIQGLTEFLPISSSGHLSIIQFFSGISGDEATMLTVMLHMGTLIAVFIAFRKTICDLIIEFIALICSIFKGQFKLSKSSPKRRMLIMLMIAQIPLLFIYPFSDYISAFGGDNDIMVEGFCFLFTAILLYASTKNPAEIKKRGDITTLDAIVVGLFQIAALMPGVSRSGSTISAGLFRGFDRETAIEFSFIMGMPAVFAANALEFAEIAQIGAEVDWLPIVVGVLAAAISGIAAIKLVSYLARKDMFKIFAYYLIALSAFIFIVSFILSVF